MQIHELNNRKKQNKEQVQEAPVLWNLGKEIYKNPKAAIMPHAFNTALGTAKQATNQQTAASQSAGLSKKGYTTAAAPKTSTEILPQVKANPATQQMIKTIAAEWQKQAAALSGQPVKEAVVAPTATATPTATQAAYKAPTTGYAQRPAGYAQTTINAPVANKPQATSTPAVQQNLQAQQAQQSQAKILQQFTTWANTKLTALTVDPDAISRDPNVSSTMKALANKIAANPANSTNDVIEYFNLAIAANIADNRARRAGFYQPQSGSQGQTTATGAAGQAPATPQDITRQAGLAPQLIQGLGAALVKADKGAMSMKRTGNPLADAMFQQMGFKLAP
jgi:hypothetical protein